MKEAIVEKARELGRLMAQTQEYQALQQANRRLGEDEDAKDMVERLAKSQQEILSYLDQGEQPPQELRQKYETAFESAQGHPAYQSLVAAQANFDKVMQKINEEIAKGVEAGDKSRIIIPD
jgi:cell fate (sporulation/competence/biofilm development) regulator YlbF (YheA/YmcA/DUF963 family)